MISHDVIDQSMGRKYLEVKPIIILGILHSLQWKLFNLFIRYLYTEVKFCVTFLLQVYLYKMHCEG